MSTALPERPRINSRASHTYAIVESLYNENFVKPMADFAVAELQEVEPTAAIDRVVAPGAFEIPLIVSTLLQKEKYHAVIAIGVLLQGETAHANLVASAVTDALMRLSIQYGRPVIHEVLLLQNESQAQARCLEPTLNRGIEAARHAIITVRMLENINPAPRTEFR